MYNEYTTKGGGFEVLPVYLKLRERDSKDYLEKETNIPWS